MDYPADKRDDIYWTMDFAELKRDSGEKTNCLDDSYVRNAFEIRISEQTQTSATVDIFSKDPDRHNWFDIYKGTAEVWQLDSNNNWKLYESKTYILTGSPFDGNYW